jgi:hypothetical protein
MTWSVIYHPDLGMVETVYDGMLSGQDIAQAAQATMVQAQAAGSLLVLANCAGLQGGHTLADLYFLARDVQQMPTAQRFHEAVLLPTAPAARATAQFWETTAANCGLQVRAFTERGAALAWLEQHRRLG